MSPPPISVLMPVYNAERYVAEAVESILAQTFRDFEFLIIDDGSTDGSRAILERYASRDGRIRLISRANTGLVVALNEMIGLAKGEFLARMDADDLAEPARFEQQLAHFRAHPECVALGSAVKIIDPDGDFLCIWNADTLTHDQIDSAHLAADRGAVICHPSVMMLARAVREVGAYRGEFFSVEDLDLFLRLAEKGRLANLAGPLLRYRMHPSSICHTQSHRQRGLARLAVREAGVRRGQGVPVVAEDLNAVSAASPQCDDPIALRRTWAWWALASGQVRTCRKHALGCLLRSPRSLDSWRLAVCAVRGR